MDKVLLTISIGKKDSKFPSKIYRELEMSEALMVKDIFNEISTEEPDLNIKTEINSYGCKSKEDN